MQAISAKTNAISLGWVLGLGVLGTVGLFGQGTPPGALVPDIYARKFVRYVDQRSLTEKTLNLVGLSSNDVGRSFAFVLGVSKYPNMPAMHNNLPAAAADVDELVEYLKNQEFFDEIVVLRDGEVTLDNLDYFLQNYFPDRLRHSPKSRFLFAYSGHGMAEGSPDNPTGYLLKSSARSLDDKLNGINMAILRAYLEEVFAAGYQSLALINACYSGAFFSHRSSFGNSTGTSAAGGNFLPKYGGAHAITAGGSNSLTWHDPRLGKGSIFFEKLLAGLGGQADTYPVYPDGHRGDGVITVDEIATYLQEEVRFATGQQQNPILADMALNRSQGGFFFLSRARTLANAVAPAWNPSRASSFGIEGEEAVIAAQHHYQASQYDQAFPLFRRAAEVDNNREAAAYLGIMYQNGFGVGADDAEAVRWYQKAAEAGDPSAMSNLGFMYRNGRGGSKNDFEAVYWFRRAAEAGDAGGMTNLGFMLRNGRGLPKDDAKAVNWFRKAADVGYADGMSELGYMYENGRGGLPKDRPQAEKWYREAAQLGNADSRRALTRLEIADRTSSDRSLSPKPKTAKPEPKVCPIDLRGGSSQRANCILTGLKPHTSFRASFEGGIEVAGASPSISFINAQFQAAESSEILVHTSSTNWQIQYHGLAARILEGHTNEHGEAVADIVYVSCNPNNNCQSSTGSKITITPLP